MAPPPLCRFRDALGVPGEGVHAARVPLTRTAALDYFGTLALAWLTSAAFDVRLSVTTVAWLLAAEALHRLFCVDVGGAGK